MLGEQSGVVGLAGVQSRHSTLRLCRTAWESSWKQLAVHTDTSMEDDEFLDSSLTAEAARSVFAPSRRYIAASQDAVLCQRAFSAPSTLAMVQQHLRHCEWSTVKVSRVTRAFQLGCGPIS